MKAIILAGDSGNKLRPITTAIPKQLLPIYNKPMIFYPIETLIGIGVKEFLVITTERHQPLFRESLSVFEKDNIHFTFACQNQPNGIALAIEIGRDFIGNDSIILATGDTIIHGKSFTEQLSKAIKAVEKSGNATIFVAKDNEPDQYGKVIVDKKGEIQSIEGDSTARNYYSITGLYVFPRNAVNLVKEIKPSERGLYEVTSLNQLFLKKTKLQIQHLNHDCTWLDTNSFESLSVANNYFKDLLSQ